MQVASTKLEASWGLSKIHNWKKGLLLYSSICQSFHIHLFVFVQSLYKLEASLGLQKFQNLSEGEPIAPYFVNIHCWRFCQIETA